MNALTATDFNFPGQQSVYHGKSARCVQHQWRKVSYGRYRPHFSLRRSIAERYSFQRTDAEPDCSQVPRCHHRHLPQLENSHPRPMVTVGVMCEGFPVEMIVRGYLCGSAWRAYKSGVREICGVKLPEGMKENQKFPQPIITPTTKAEIGRA